MLTFAARFAPAKARPAEPADSVVRPAPCDAAGPHQTYWPCELMNAFALKMAASGHCVNMSMMLGHRPYALDQLACARSVHDSDLQTLVAQLQPYFNAPAQDAFEQGDGQVSTQTLLRPWPLAS